MTNPTDRKLVERASEDDDFFDRLTRSPHDDEGEVDE